MGPMVPMPLGSTDGARTNALPSHGRVAGSIPVAAHHLYHLEMTSLFLTSRRSFGFPRQDMAHEIPWLRIRPWSQIEPNGRDTRLTKWAGGFVCSCPVGHLIWRNQTAPRPAVLAKVKEPSVDITITSENHIGRGRMNLGRSRFAGLSKIRAHS